MGPDKKFKKLMPEWMDLNQKGMSLKKISDKYNVSYATVRRYFKFYNVKVKNEYVSAKKINAAIALMKKDLSQREINKKTGLSRGFIKKLADKNQKKFTSNKKHEIKYENFFEVIDTHEKAYWLGYVYADGCIIYDKERNWYRIAFNVAKKDRDLLERIKETLCTTAIIRENKNNNGLHLELSSEKLFKDLEKYGVTEKKSLTIKFPKNLDKKFYNSFILGYFDGDGCVYQNVEKEKMVQFDFIGTNAFLEEAQKVLIQNIGLNKTKIRKAGKAFRVVYTGRIQLGKIYDWLYKDIDESVPLQRKKIIFENIKKNVR